MEYKNKYRIVTDKYAGYEVQIQKRFLFIKWWKLCNFANTHKTIESAKEYIDKLELRNRKFEVVWVSDSH